MKLNTFNNEFGEANLGSLLPIELNQLPFIPKRIFFVKDVPSGVTRGEHAHFKTQQLLVCLRGKIKVSLHDGKNLTSSILEENETIFVDKMIWDSQEFLTYDSILLSLASTNYDKSDYIEDFDLFTTLTKDSK